MTRAAFRNLLGDILDVPRGALQDADTRDTLSSWTSLADVKILTTITSELGVEPDAELMEAETIGDLLGVLEDHDAFSA